MSIITSPMLLGADTGGAYQITRSLRFNAPDSAYLSRTPSVAGNRRVFTWAGWIKRCKLGSRQSIFSAGTGNLSGDPGGGFYFDNITDTFSVVHGGGTTANITSAQVFRDVSAWFHLVVTYDTTQATSSNRIKIYVNGLQISLSGTYPSSSFQTDFNNTVIHAIGSRTDDGPLPASTADYYFADVFFIDGQALDPSSFTTTDPTTGQLIPKAYSGSGYGTNGFHLPFSDNSATTATTLGKDTSGNNNNWTPNNFSVTTGAGNDSLVDTPSSAGTDTGVGGVVTGNYATWNPLLMNSSYMTAVNGNLDATCQNSNYNPAALNIHVRVGGSSKWYCEFSFSATPLTNFMGFGLSAETSSIFGTNQIPGSIYMPNGQKSINGTKTSYGSTYTAGDIIGVAIDEATGSLTCYKNGVSQGLLTTLTTGTYQFIGVNYGIGTVMTVNAGQRPFAYTAPSGFKALCDTNLPAPVVAKPNTVMDVVTYTGTGASRSITGLGFSPDFVWIKERGAAGGHNSYDTVRGASVYLASESTNAEGTDTDALTAFNSNGFSLGSGYTVKSANGFGRSYVAWTWDAGTSTVTNTQGSITSSVRANQSAGFSIATYTGNNTANATFGHGLGVTPEFVVIKKRSSTGNWIVYHKGMTSSAYYMYLNATDAQTNQGGAVNTWGVSSTLITLKELFGDYNASGATYVAYCFAPVSGYSSFGSYTGNGSADGPFVFCNFRPRWILTKSTTNGTLDWNIFDAARDSYNSVNKVLYPNLSNAESDYSAYTPFDFLSNGFKLRSNIVWNASSTTYIYAAFAESPFQYARAR